MQILAKLVFWGRYYVYAKRIAILVVTTICAYPAVYPLWERKQSENPESLADVHLQVEYGGTWTARSSSD